MCGFVQWLTKHKEVISSSTAVAGVVLATAGFVLAYCQLSATTEALRASNAYQIQKDARELNTSLFSDANFRDAVVRAEAGPHEAEFQRQMWLIFHFYTSVFRQSSVGGIDPVFTTAFARDFCDFMKNPGAERVWRLREREDRLSADQVTMRRRWCR